jgi:hypothetical protein
VTEPPADESVWAQYLAANDLPADTPMPVQLDKIRYRKESAGLLHCENCGGIAFQAVIALDTTGQPVSVLPPQTCIGCGWQRQVRWPH